ncbi:MAG: hypothetical protein Q8S33_02525 [Myxococcales bacterium]|nr:hypothetical protein [Myxococcales bacterium]
MDVDAPEPIHWSTNDRMLRAARAIKPTILAPHPWALLTRKLPTEQGRGTLVVGPPPSPSNDGRLLEVLSGVSRDDTTILVKARGSYRGSIAFWEHRGFKTTTAEAPDGRFYERLHSVLSRFETVMGPTFSSALVFAAALRKRVVLVPNFVYTAYEPTDYEAEVNLSSPDAQRIVRIFADAPQNDVTDTAHELLGFDRLSDRERVRNDLLDAISQLKRPLYVNPNSVIPYQLRAALAVRLNKPGLLRYSTRQVVKLLNRRHVCVMRINELDVWLNGKNPTNFSLTPIQFQKGVTEPGFAPGGY